MEPKPYLKTRFRVKVSEHSDADHWLGGKPYHQEAMCPACKIPLLLLWDINCKDSRFPRKKFGSLERLPFYYCWGCVNDISYQIIEGNRLRIHRTKRSAGRSFPYKPYPKSFERRPLTLHEGIPEEIRRIVQEMIAKSDKDDDSGPSRQERASLREFFGHEVPMELCLFHHQFGGKPLQRNWFDQVFDCPNPSCSGKVTDRLRGKKRAMKFLAGVINDPWGGLPMVDAANNDTKKSWNYFVSVQFHICDCCWTILACNRCD